MKRVGIRAIKEGVQCHVLPDQETDLDDLYVDIIEVPDKLLFGDTGELMKYVETRSELYQKHTQSLAEAKFSPTTKYGTNVH